jgi:peptide/nickel transport system substrate-binding protein
VPETAIWAFEPGAHFGVHRIDEYYFEDALQQVTQ